MCEVGMAGERYSSKVAPANGGSAWIWFMGVGVAVTIGYYILPVLNVDRVVQSLVFIVVSTAAAIAVLVGVYINKPASRFPWLVLAAAQGMYSIGDTVYFVLHTVLGREDYPDLADLLYLMQFPLICWALVIFVRRRTPGRDRVALIDAAVLAIPAGMIAWIFVISSRNSSGESPVTRRWTCSYSRWRCGSCSASAPGQGPTGCSSRASRFSSPPTPCTC
jgi:hypothetical protein